MNNNGKLEAIKKILDVEYRGKMSEQSLKAFANELNNSLFAEQYGLDEIPAIINEFEVKANIEDSEGYYIFDCMIDLLDNNETTAKKLYNSFMYDFDCLDTFLKLYNENSGYISAEQLRNAKEKALEIFDRQTLESCGII